MGIIYVTGGARSGKSSFAESLAQSEKNKVYLATAKVYDEEMCERVKKHREQRGDQWGILEAHSDLDTILSKSSNETGVILLDCLTNMVANLMLGDMDIEWEKITPNELSNIEQEINLEIDKLIEFSKSFTGELIVVSNELGMGIVPSYHLGRYFRDIAGRVNQRMAKESKEAYLIVSGIPIKLK